MSVFRVGLNSCCRGGVIRLPFTFVALVWLGTSLAECQDSSNRVRIVLAGDSTVTDDAGWGRGFGELLHPDKAECINLAKSGRSSRSYRAEGWWEKCLAARPKYLLIQFGHNDQPGKGPERESDHQTAFRDHLRAYLDEARANEILPILVTSLTRRRWKADGKIEPTLAEYAEATRAVAMEKKVPLIDLHSLSIKQCEQLGPIPYRAFEPMNEKGADHTHLNLEGSRAVGPLVAEGLMHEVPETEPLFLREKIEQQRVPQSYSKSIVRGELTLQETEQAIEIRQGRQLVLAYNKVSPAAPPGVKEIFQRSGFLHPVASPRGTVVTAVFPRDHPHQQGIFAAWVKTTWNERPIDFWNLGSGTGRVLHQRVLNTFGDDRQVGFHVDLIHRTEQDPVVDVLRDSWKITAYQTDGSYHQFDLQTRQVALTSLPLQIEHYHYGGVAVRGRMEWVKESNEGKENQESTTAESCEMVNDQGSDRIQGNHQSARWVTLQGSVEGQQVSITMLGHRQNFRDPQPARLHPTKPYFVFSPCVNEGFTIDQNQPFSGRYRFLVTDSRPDPKWIEQQWLAWQETTP
jgi:lysophospholipase L1-like esterase